MIDMRTVYGVGIVVFGILGLGGCAPMEPKPFEPSEGHIQPDAADKEKGTIPEVVSQAPILPEPAPSKPLEKYTVVVNEVPVKELLFALARDADLNVDIYPGIEGAVTLNAVDQTLPQILDRISRQINIRYEFKGDNIIVTPDDPYFKSYRLDYVNIARDTTASNQLTTQISTTGGTGTGSIGTGGGGASGRGGQGNNNSTTSIESVSFNRFWQTLVVNISAILGDPISGTDSTSDIPVTENVIASPETGILNVRATSREHELIGEFVSQMEESAQRQVLIQATIVEVDLNDQYQAGIDWTAIDAFDSGIDIISRTLNPAVDVNAPVQGALTQAVVTASDRDSAGNIKNQVLVRLLEQFGDTRVLSSPQLMAMNNQTAILKVVENFVFFEIDSDVSTGALGAEPVVSVDTIAQTVPVGIVMTLTPQINDAGVITLNVRPTISRVTDFIDDPSPNQLTGVINQVPQVEVREMESMLRLTSGQIAVLGGLMENSTQDDDDRIPGFSDIPLVGKFFSTKTKNYRKRELVIFLRPIVVNNPSIEADLRDYRTFLRDVRNDLPGSGP